MKAMKYPRIKRACAFLMILLALALSAGGCGRREEGPPRGISMEDLEKRMLSADPSLPEMDVARGEDEDAEVTFGSLCGFDFDRAEDYFYAYADGGSAQEISVVCLKDPSDAALLMKELKAHVRSRKGTMENYSPDQVPLVEDYVLLREGPYVALIICEKAESVRNAFESFF